MGAEQGDFKFSANFETAKKALLDAKMYVEDYADLITYTTDRYLFKMPVFCAGLDDPTKLGWWFLADPTNPQLYTSWQQISLPAIVNGITQNGSFSFNNVTYKAILGATTEWGFNEEGQQYLVGNTEVTYTAPDPTLPRQDLLVWRSLDGYDVIDGIPSNDPVIPDVPLGYISVKAILRNVDGSTEIPPAPDLSVFAKLNGGNNFSGRQVVNDNSFQLRTPTSQGSYDLYIGGKFRYAVVAFEDRFNISAGNDLGTGSFRLLDIDRATKDSKFYGKVKGLPGVDSDDFATMAQVGGGGSTDASDLTSGTLADARLSANVPIKVGGLIQSSDLPAYVDDVLEFANLASFPVTGEQGKIYVALDSNKQYRWSGSIYIQITNGLIASTADVPDSTNKRYQTDNQNTFNDATSSIQGQLNGKTDKSLTINNQTASYTLVLGDNGKMIEMNVASVNNLTIPLNSSVPFPIGAQIIIYQMGVGQTTFVATGGVTIRQRQVYMKLAGQYALATLIKKDTDTWILGGDLAL